MNRQADAEIPQSPAGHAFRSAARGKLFGYAETMDAWRWFADGWNAMARRAMHEVESAR